MQGGQGSVQVEQQEVIAWVYRDRSKAARAVSVGANQHDLRVEYRPIDRFRQAFSRIAHWVGTVLSATESSLKRWNILEPGWL